MSGDVRNRFPAGEEEVSGQMALARVVSFDGVSSARMAEMQARVQESGRPEDVPATEMLLLHNPESETALAIIFFDDEEDYQQGDAALSAMPALETPGRRSSVTRYEVAVRMTA
jgi:hypothetical protein